MKGGCQREWAARGEGGEGRGGSQPGSQEDTLGVQVAPGGPGRRAPPRPPSLPPSLTYQPMRACQRRRFSVQWSPGRPWKRLPAGTTSVQAALSLAVRAEAGQRPPLIGWRPHRRRNATGGRSAGRTDSGRTERFRCVW